MSISTPVPVGTDFATIIDENSEHHSYVQGLLNTRSFGAFYNLRSQRFLGTTGYLSFNLNTAANMAAIRNPTGSGKWVFFDVIEFGAVGATSRFTRFGGGTFSVSGSAEPVAKTDGSAVASGEGVLQIYKPTATGYSASGGTIRKVAPMKDSEPYFVEAFGSVILRPGAHVYWTTNEPPGGGAGAYEAYINFEWVEIAEADATALVTAAQAVPLA